MFARLLRSVPPLAFYLVYCQSLTAQSVLTTQEIGDGGPAIRAVLNGPTSLTFDPKGNLYIVEMAGNRIRKVESQTGIVSTVVGHGEECLGNDCEYSDREKGTELIVGGLQGVASDSEGMIYFSQIGKGLIRRLDMSTGRVQWGCPLE